MEQGHSPEWVLSPWNLDRGAQIVTPQGYRPLQKSRQDLLRGSEGVPASVWDSRLVRKGRFLTGRGDFHLDSELSKLPVKSHIYKAVK